MTNVLLAESGYHSSRVFTPCGCFSPDYARGEESPDPKSWRINDLLVK
jgi:hypothetical protein